MRSVAIWSSASWPRSASAISPFTAATAFRTPLPPNRPLSPSRSSTASRVPVTRPRAPRRARVLHSRERPRPRRSGCPAVDDLPSAHTIDDCHPSSPSRSGRPGASCRISVAPKPGSSARRLARHLGNAQQVRPPEMPNGIPPVTVIVSPGPANPSRVTIAQALSTISDSARTPARARRVCPRPGRAGARWLNPASGSGSERPGARGPPAAPSCRRPCR